MESFYDSHAEIEWARLEHHKMEFATTWRAMEEFIPAHSTILDVGGGPGRYSIKLAQAGHRVTLLDLSRACVELARRKAAEMNAPLAGFIHGDALDLSRFRAGEFDVVLLMGPLYHLVDPAQRDRAVREALRVLKTGGLLFAAFVTRYAFLIDVLKHSPEAIGTYTHVQQELLSTGINIESEENPGFTDAYFAHPAEIEPFMAGHGLRTVRLAAAEGIVAPAEPAVNNLPDDLFARWVDVCYRLGADPVTWGAAEHMLYVGRKL
ncbi:MAG: class I SAM-dependent methyltransferase [Firmicutes bacterium]|nr:class I SAM-dependent methyltransferase [Bacillota bacterium]